MSTMQVSAQSTVERLLQMVKQLPPAELGEFTQRFVEWQDQNGIQMKQEAALIRATQARLPAADERRLKR